MRAKPGQATALLAEALASWDPSAGCWVWPYARRTGCGVVVNPNGPGMAYVHRLAFQWTTGLSDGAAA